MRSRFVLAAATGVALLVVGCRGQMRTASTGYRHRALVLGLGNLRSYKPDEPLPGAVGPRRGAYEVIAIVKAGSAPVLTLPRAEWRSVGLLYDPARFRDDGAYLPKNTTRAMRV